MRTKRNDGLQRGATRRVAMMLAVAIAWGLCLHTAQAQGLITDWQLIDDFQSYDTGRVRATGDDVTDGVWVAHDNHGAAHIAEDSTGKYIRTGRDGSPRAVSRTLDPSFQLASGGGIATYFMRVRVLEHNDQAIFTLSKEGSTSTIIGEWDDFMVRVNISGTEYNGHSVTDWVNFWMVVDRETVGEDSYALYMTTGHNEAQVDDLIGSNIAFDNDITDPLGRIMVTGIGEEAESQTVPSAQMLEVHYSEGQNLTFIPEPSTGGLMVLGLAAAAAAFRRRFNK